MLYEVITGPAPAQHGVGRAGGEGGDLLQGRTSGWNGDFNQPETHGGENRPDDPADGHGEHRRPVLGERGILRP